MSNKINIILNGKQVEGEQGETILSVARRNNIDIPTLCNDERLEPNSSCFLCVVEIDANGRKMIQPSCSTVIAEGMKIETHNDSIRKSRKTALELLLSNHYADCVAPCHEACPAGVDIQGYISLIEKGMYVDAIGLIKEVNPLPAICGRVCVRPCENACRRNNLGEGAPVAIDYLKRFAADKDFEAVDYYKPDVMPSTGKKVAIIGAGPGGLSAAWFLQLQGHQCDIYEAAPYPGGWLRYGIPEYRLPNDILDKEISRITELGVNIYCNKKFGDNLSYKDIKANYDATVLTIGSQKGALLRAEGDDAENVFSGIDFLRNMEITGQRYDFSGKKVAVVGGGNTAMDCCRTAIRCGSKDVRVIYRRTEKEMPANPIEVHESKLEGVKYDFLTNPICVNKDSKGKIKSLTLVKMELGEPDESGRRRPKPIEGSEYDEEFDYVLAAIGQKTEINFLEDVNKYADNGKLSPNKWGDLEVNNETLQTGIESMFAAGDGVSGPATIIEAIAQAKIAANSCNQYLFGETIKSAPKEFFSRKENFKNLDSHDFAERYKQQFREEMPTLEANMRVNFKEVELGYKNDDVAKHETGRCLECGCSEVYECDLKAFSTEYNADQKAVAGSYHEYDVDSSHPFIEIDNNKCVLCTRCVRICRDVVGANALGLVNRGFDTYIAPAIGQSLSDTNCESCGLCISACPTGAITENFLFKVLPAKTESETTICNYCSVGCSIDVHHVDTFVSQVRGSKGLVNTDGNLCRYAKFGYHYLNDKSRITSPMIKQNGEFVKVSWNEAYNYIYSELNNRKAQQSAVMAGARLSNEELYLIKTFAENALETKNIGSFHYLGRNYDYVGNNNKNTPFEQLKDAGKIYLLGATLNQDNAVLGFMVQNAVVKNHIPLISISEAERNAMTYKVDVHHRVKSYYQFVKALNYYFLAKGVESKMFIDAQCDGFDDYKNKLLSEDYKLLLTNAWTGTQQEFEKFADDYNLEPNAILIYSEKEINSATSIEITNLLMLTGKLGKTSSGVIALKEKNNSQGLIDMGIAPNTEIGGKLTGDRIDLVSKFNNGDIKNLLIFGEDPIATAKNKETIQNWFRSVDFLVVQDAFLTETAKIANVILPASFHVEQEGSFTNTSRFIQTFKPMFKPRVDYVNLEQLPELLKLFGVTVSSDANSLLSDISSKLPEGIEPKLTFRYTDSSYGETLFNHGADNIYLRFVHFFEEEFTKARVEVTEFVY